MKAPLSSKDYEVLSACLDDQLGPADKMQLEAKLKADSDMRLAFEELTATRTLLRKAKQYRAPRNFTLSPEMARKHRRQSFFVRLPTYRFSMALSALSLLVVLVLEITNLMPMGAAPQYALAPAAAPLQMEKAMSTQAAEPEATMEIQWQNGITANGFGGGSPDQPLAPAPEAEFKVQPSGGGGNGNEPIESPLAGPVQLPAASIAGLTDSAPLPMPTTTPSDAQRSTAAEQNTNPILGIPPEGDGGKMITSNGELEEIPAQALELSQFDRQAETKPEPALPAWRTVELALLALAVLTGATAFLFRRSSRR